MDVISYEWLTNVRPGSGIGHAGTSEPGLAGPP